MAARRQEQPGERREVGVAIKGLYRKDPCGVGTILDLDRMTISLMVMIL